MSLLVVVVAVLVLLPAAACAAAAAAAAANDDDDDDDSDDAVAVAAGATLYIPLSPDVPRSTCPLSLLSPLSLCVLKILTFSVVLGLPYGRGLFFGGRASNWNVGPKKLLIRNRPPGALKAKRLYMGADLARMARMHGAPVVPLKDHRAMFDTLAAQR